jgi:hypothetical protein
MLMQPVREIILWQVVLIQSRMLANGTETLEILDQGFNTIVTILELSELFQ